MNTRGKGTDTKECKDFMAALPDLLLDSSPGSGLDRRWTTHLAACAACRSEWAELQATWSALSAWEAPEPSAYFDSRMHARMREAVSAPPEGFGERMRSFFLFSTGRQLRPALVGALGLVLLVGGGSGVIGLRHHLAATQNATLNDLKLLDNNAQALQQMDQLLDENGGDDGGAEPTT